MWHIALIATNILDPWIFDADGAIVGLQDCGEGWIFFRSACKPIKIIWADIYTKAAASVVVAARFILRSPIMQPLAPCSRRPFECVLNGLVANFDHLRLAVYQHNLPINIKKAIRSKSD